MGVVNGIVYVFGRLPHPFIITLATLSICRGLALELSIDHTTMRGMPPGVTFLGETSALGIPNAFFVVFGVALIVLVLTKSMVWGRWTYAVGGNPKAAVEMGIPVKWVLVSTYIIAGLCAGVGAVILRAAPARRRRSMATCSNSTRSPPSSSAGRASLAGAAILVTRIVGAVMIGVIRNALNLMNVDVFFQMIAIGLIIVLAVESDVLRNHLEARARVKQAARTQ